MKNIIKPSSEKNFDQYSSRLNKNIYGSLKGKIRLKILSDDLDLFLRPNQTPLNILDAGCGSGQCSNLLALAGHRLTLCDVSKNMIDNAKILFTEKGVQNAEFIHETIEDHAKRHQSCYDLILCHAVVEWTQEPMNMLDIINSMLKPNGHLSLMFFNRNGTILKAVLRGNFYSKDAGFKFGQTKSLTPINPLDPEKVYQWMKNQDMKIITKSGIRMFYDYCDKSVRDELAEENVLNCESSFSKSEPYISIARYIHILSQKKANN